MSHVCTLIAAPGAETLNEALVSRAREALPGAGTPQWLAPGDACDIPFTPAVTGGMERAMYAMAVREAIDHAPVDIAIIPADKRRKWLLVADMDSTIIQQECIDEIADFAGLKPKIAAITERAMRGELEFESALRERVGLLKGLEESVLARVFDERIELMPGAVTLVQTMRAYGAHCALVSGGFTYFTARVAEAAGFHSNQANKLEIANGELTGTVAEPILGQDAKLAALQSFVQEREISLEDSMAVGDGANDLAMIREAGIGVAYRAKPVVAAQAAVGIDHGDLTALLYLQGYKREEFAA